MSGDKALASASANSTATLLGSFRGDEGALGILPVDDLVGEEGALGILEGEDGIRERGVEGTLAFGVEGDAGLLPDALLGKPLLIFSAGTETGLVFVLLGNRVSQDQSRTISSAGT